MLRNLGVHDAGTQFSGPDGSVFLGPVVTLLSSASYRNDRNWKMEISRNALYSRLHTHTHTHLYEWKILLALSGNRHSEWVFLCIWDAMGSLGPRMVLVSLLESPGWES